jgi:hypothetical protein
METELLNEQLLIEEVTRKLETFFQTNENTNTKYQNL